MAKKKVTKRAATPKVDEPEQITEDKPEKKVTKSVKPVNDGVITVQASLPNGASMAFSYTIPNIHHNIPPVKIAKMKTFILKGLQEGYGRGVKLSEFINVP